MEERNIEYEIEKTLNSLETIENAKTDAYFYTRLKARMDNEASPAIFFGKRSVQMILAALVLLLCINVFSYFNLKNQYNLDTRTANLESFASSYGLEYKDMYDVNIDVYE